MKLLAQVRQLIRKKHYSIRTEQACLQWINNFSIRHHDPSQKRGYDENIWYSWIFHFYLATYHAVIRLLQKYEKGTKVQ